MKERPILFSAPMVRAILEGRKTQTRRIVSEWGSGGCEILSCAGVYLTASFGSADFECRYRSNGFSAVKNRPCPYGAIGDRLWVRETWADLTESHGQKWERYNEQTRLYDRGRTRFIWYRADGEQPMYDGEPAEKWRPSIFMRRADSRITLEITDVRVQRVQEITPDDAEDEGMKAITKDGKLVKYGIPDRDGLPGEDDDGWPWHDWRISPVDAFGRLWDSINKKRAPWNSNPWVWAISFRLIEAGA